MPQTTRMPVRLGGALRDFVSANVGDGGSCESESIRDLIRCDKERVDADAFNRLKAELNHAFAAPEVTYGSFSAAEVIARNRG